MERKLGRLSWLKVRELVPSKIDTVILPVGTVEAHGSACIGTDDYIPEFIANSICERLNALVAPTINYGITRSLYRYNGGSTINENTFMLYVRDVLDSLADSGFRNIVVMNGHGGNNAALKAAGVEFHHRRRANVAIIHWWELCGEMTKKFFGHAGGHAGTDETAVVQAIDSNIVDRSSYDPELAYYMRPGADVYPVPGSILLYKEGEGYPNFDQEQATQFRDRMVAEVAEFAEMVIKRWRKFGL
jgi:creatinine amidohydrolase